jgi:type VI secretion system protein ImpG
MRPDLLGYYERELSFLRQMGAQFAERYPKIASRLTLEADRCEDPHVERLLETFAFLSARIQLKVDDEFPQITESFLDLLYPNLLAPLPAMTVVQFVMDPSQGALQTGHTIPRGSIVFARPVDGTSCRFQTSYPVKLWPVEIRSVKFELPFPGVGPQEGVRSLMRMEFKTFGGVPLKDLKEKVSESEEKPLSGVRLYLQGDGRLQNALYEQMLNNVVEVELRPPGPRDVPSPVRLRHGSIQPAGFEKDEALLPQSDRFFQGYRLLQEYFSFPEKFFFLDISGLDAVGNPPFTDSFEIVFYFNREFPLERQVTAQSFRSGCTPVVNLFRQIAEPIRLTHFQPEYRVIPDVRRQEVTEVHSITSVGSIDRSNGKLTEYQPFYSIRHGGEREKSATFWYATRRPSILTAGETTDIFLSLVDLGFNAAQPETETITVETLCSNAALPSRLPFPMHDGDLQLEGAGIFSAIRCLRKPTLPVRLPLRRGLHWRLISHLSLNVLSLLEAEPDKGPDALREILALYDFADSSVTRQQIQSLSKVSTRRVLRSIGTLYSSFVRGLEVTIDLDESLLTGSGPFLFASVLERFFGLYVSINSFTELVARVNQREGVLKRWSPRSGEQIIA